MRCKLGDVLTVKHGYPFKGEYFNNLGQYIVLTPANFHEEGGFKYTPGKEKYYSSSFPKEYTCKKGDLIVVMTQQAEGLLGSTAFVPEDDVFLHNQRIGLISTDRDKLIPEYAYYLFRTQSVREQIRNSASGTKVKHTSPEKIYDVIVDLPTIETQKTVSALLLDIEEKIQINRDICADLEATAKLLYDYWFVQFDFPDENGKQYKSSGGKMVWNEELKREIPEGWKVGNLYDIADFVNGLACQKFRPLDDSRKLPVIKIGEMHNGFGSDVEWARDDVPSKHVIHNGDILFSWSASLEVMLWDKGTGVLNQHIFNVVPKMNKYYVFQQLSAYVVNFVRMAEARKTTMGHITTDHLSQSRIVMPPSRITDKFGEMVNDLFERSISCSEENKQLASLRDFLLPMLMNGQVKVGEGAAS